MDSVTIFTSLHKSSIHLHMYWGRYTILSQIKTYTILKRVLNEISRKSNLKATTWLKFCNEGFTVVTPSVIYSAVLLNLFWFRSPLSSIAAFPFTFLWMYGWCGNNHSTSSALLHNTICSTLSTACFPPCSKLATIFIYDLNAYSALQNVFCFVSSAYALFK